MGCRIATQGQTSQVWRLRLAPQGLATSSPGVSLLHSTVNFDHFQILRAIGKGSFGKVRKSLSGWASGGWGHMGPQSHTDLLHFSSEKLAPSLGQKVQDCQGRSRGSGLSGVVSATLHQLSGRGSWLS